MNSNKINQPFSIKIESSKGKQLLIVLPHLFALIVLFLFVDLRDSTKYIYLVALLSLLGSVIYFVRLHLTLNLDQSVHTIHVLNNDMWQLSLKNETLKELLVSDTSFTSNYLIIINFIDSSKKNYSVLISSDSVDKETYRKLKVRIKTKRS